MFYAPFITISRAFYIFDSVGGYYRHKHVDSHKALNGWMAINALADANFDTLLLLVVMLDVVDLRLYIIRFIIIIVPILSMLFALHPIDVPAIFTLTTIFNGVFKFGAYAKFVL